MTQARCSVHPAQFVTLELTQGKCLINVKKGIHRHYVGHFSQKKHRRGRRRRWGKERERRGRRGTEEEWRGKGGVEGEQKRNGGGKEG